MSKPKKRKRSLQKKASCNQGAWYLTYTEYERGYSVRADRECKIRLRATTKEAAHEEARRRWGETTSYVLSSNRAIETTRSSPKLAYLFEEDLHDVHEARRESAATSWMD